VKLKLVILSLLLLPLVARAEAPIGPVERPYKSVLYKHEKFSTTTQDKDGKPVVYPQQVFAAFVDLTDPNVSVRVERGGDDPDGPGEWQTTLMQPTKVAEREGFDVIVNGDFYAVHREKGPDGKEKAVQYPTGIAAKVSGPAVSDGEKWAPAENKRAALLINAQGKPVIAEMKDPPSDAKQVVAGSDVIVQNGQNVAPPGDKPGFARGPHPRTAVGIRDGGNTLVLVVIDGRKKGVAIGTSLKETADRMLKYGCTDAVNLDGGGSSMLGIRNPKTGKMEIKNNPSDGRERSVANVLGVTVTPKKK
jgi:exopolysaccharide biosynthesis protein